MQEKIDELYEEYIRRLMHRITIDPPHEKEEIEPVKPRRLGKNQIYGANGTIYDVYSIYPFHNGRAKVTIVVRKKDHDRRIKESYIDENYQLISPWYTSVNKFIAGWSLCTEDIFDSKKYYIDRNGKRLIDEPIERAYDVFDKALIKWNGKYALYEKTLVKKPKKNELPWKKLADFGELDLDTNYGKGQFHYVFAIPYELTRIYVNRNFVTRKKNTTWSGEVISTLCCYTIDTKDYSVKNKVTHYELRNKNDVYTTKYKPIKVFNDTYTLCHKAKCDLCLYNRKTGEYIDVGKTNNTFFDDNFIVSYDGDKVTQAYLVYGEELVDVTNYYDKWLKNIVDGLDVKKGYKVFSKEDFVFYGEEKIKELVREEELKRIEIERQKEVEKLQKLQETDEIKAKKNKITIDEAVHQIIRAVKSLNKMSNIEGQVVRIKIDEVFINVARPKPHKEINPLYVETGLLKYVDLNSVDFKNAKINGMDFSTTNINIDPQMLYKDENGIVDLSGCNFEGIDFRVSTNFKNVNICGSKFSNDGSFRTFDINENTLAEGIYDEKTTLNGTAIVDLLKEKKK